jgi:hypothetical protein
MPTMIPKFGVRDPLKTCWQCEHVQWFGWLWEGDPQTPPVMGTRQVKCSEKSVTVGGFTDPDGNAIAYPQTPGFWIGGPDQIETGRRILFDGTRNWCSQWRQSSLEVPPIPELPR